MKPEQLFEELISERSIKKRQLIVDKGLQDGVDLNTIREMLDYIEFCESTKTQPARNICLTRKQETRTLRSLIRWVFQFSMR
jgi:hypothetical protein